MNNSFHSVAALYFHVLLKHYNNPTSCKIFSDTVFSLLICKPHSVKSIKMPRSFILFRNTQHRAGSSADSWKRFKHFSKIYLFIYFFPYWRYDSVARLLSRSPLHIHRANSANDDLTFVTRRVEPMVHCAHRGTDAWSNVPPRGLLWVFRAALSWSTSGVEGENALRDFTLFTQKF